MTPVPPLMDSVEVIQADELLPCPNPWCNSHAYPDGAPSGEHDIWEYEHWYRVHCPSCTMRGPHADTSKGAVKAWNTRHRAQQSLAVVEALREIRDCKPQRHGDEGRMLRKCRNIADAALTAQQEKQG